MEPIILGVLAPCEPINAGLLVGAAILGAVAFSVAIGLAYYQGAVSQR